MITLGLDPSLTGFGWCVHNSAVSGPGRVVEKGQFATSPRDIFIERYRFMRASVGEVIERFPQIEAIGAESSPFGELWSEGLFGLYLYVMEAIFLHRKDLVYFDPLTLKALVKIDPKLRKGQMFKSDMVDAAKADTGIKGKFNHNEADAYHIARFTARFWDFFHGRLVESELTPSEKHTFTRTHTYQRGKHAGETVKAGLVFREDDRFFRFSLLEKGSNDPSQEGQGRAGEAREGGEEGQGGDGALD